RRGKSTATGTTTRPGWRRRSGTCWPDRSRRSGAQHRRGLVERADAGVHPHRLVEAVEVGGLVAAPAAFAHHDRRDVAIERLAHAGLDPAIGRAAADDYDVAPQHVQQLGDAGAPKGARPALE